MPCLIIILALLLPRVVLFFIWLLTDWFKVFNSTIISLLGFIFMPYTTLAYMAGMLNAGAITGWWLVLLIVAIIVDVGHWSAGANSRRRRI